MKERGPIELIETLERRYRRMRRSREFWAQVALSLTMTTGSVGAIEAYNALTQEDTLPHD